MMTDRSEIPCREVELSLGEDEFNFFLQELIVLAQLASCSIVLHFIFHIWFLFIEYFKDSDSLGIYAIAPLFIELEGIFVGSSPS